MVLQQARTRHLSLRLAPAVGRIVVGITWLLHAALKFHGGVGTETLYAEWIGRRTDVHGLWVLCEASLGLWLLSGFRLRAALFASLYLLSMLSGLVLFEPTPRPCGCGWAQRSISRDAAIQSMRWTLGRNGFLMVLTVVAIACLPKGSTGQVRHEERDVAASA